MIFYSMIYRTYLEKNPDFLYNNDTDDYIKKPDRIKLDKESNKVELPIYIEKISQYVNDFVLYLKNTVEYNEEIEIPLIELLFNTNLAKKEIKKSFNHSNY